MTSPAIRVENLGKSYIISHEGDHKTDRITDEALLRFKRISRNFKRAIKGEQLLVGEQLEEFWALKNLNFEVYEGERLGIIGKNGAGKSTLLKVLSRITEPSRGKITVHGRLASLLEVGTGFHPELSGRENIFLNGAVLGMSRTDVTRLFDEIVSFAEVEKFLDTPVKRYSSGMYVRLAFAVAAHLEPDILVVDEVLAVGDAKFQKKCIGKIQDVSKNEGRTVLIVSHNMATIKSMCSRGIVLDKGEIVYQGNISESIQHYMQTTGDEVTSSKYSNADIQGKVGVLEAVVQDRSDSAFPTFSFKLKIYAESPIRAALNIKLKDELGMPVGFGSTYDLNEHEFHFKKGQNHLEIDLEPINLAEGSYKVSLELVIPNLEYLEKLDDILTVHLSSETNLNREYKLQQKWGYGSVGLRVKKMNLA
jgi:lipopolysaccharide transport system ATP-binding protein